MEKDIDKKVQLLLGGDILVPKDFRPPFRLSRSTAGPGAGKMSIAFEFNGMRVKKGISFDQGDFELFETDGKFGLKKDGKVFIENIEIIPIIFHSPNHAFFNLDQRCIYRCAFCASPLLGNDHTKGLTNEKIIEMIKNAEIVHVIPSIALTSGVNPSVQASVERMASCVKELRSEFPDKIIGVEPYVENEEQIDILKEAGADEFKLNRETPRKDIFERICPELDHNEILKMLKYAVKVFGKGKVASNVIYGMGETDADVLEEMERLAQFGCIPGLRALKVTGINKEQLEDVLGTLDPVSSERMIFLANEQKRIMERYGMTTRTFRTMCFECQCCDITPFFDL